VKPDVNTEAREFCPPHSLAAVTGAYLRETAVETRRGIMQAWADWLQGKTNVVALRAAA